MALCYQRMRALVGSDMKNSTATIFGIIALCGGLPARLSSQPAASYHIAAPSVVVTPDSSPSDSDEMSTWGLRSGFSTGTLRYQGGRMESAAALLVKLTLGEQVSIGITPTFAHVTYPAATRSSAGNVSGLTDIPVGIGFQHSFGGRFEPSLALSLGGSIPVGDTAKGLGSGSVGSSFDVSGGFAPFPGTGVSVGVGHSFSDFSVLSVLNGTASGWADLSAWDEVTDRFSLSGGYDRDIGPVDSAYGRSSSVTAGLSYKLFKEGNVAISAGRGLTGASPLWSFSVGIGTAIPSTGGGFHNAVSQLAAAFGGGSHGLSKKSSSGASATSTASQWRGRKKIRS